VYGEIGENIVDAAPLNDDILYIFTSDSVFAFVGDPGYNGVIDHFCSLCGLVAANAWCFDTSGTLYWLGRGGLYRLPKGYTIPQCLSSTVLRDYFSGLDYGGLNIRLKWYEDVHQLWITASPITFSGVQGIHMVWDSATGAFLPQQFGTGLIIQGDPQAIFAFDIFPGNAPQDRVLLMGCRDGYIRKYHGSIGFDATFTSDDGTAITSYCYLGASRPVDDLNEGNIQCLDLYTGFDKAGLTYNLNYQLQAAPDSYNAISNPDLTAANTISTQGHFKDYSMRMRGGSFALYLSNSTLNATWNLERIIASFTPGAPIRTVT
jgi:hypothetical protein